MGLCIGPSAPQAGWDPVLKASVTSTLPTNRQTSILTRFFNHFDVLHCGKLGEEEIVLLLQEFLNDAEKLHFYLYGQEFGRRLARIIPLDVRLSGVSYDIWRKEFSDRPEKFLSTCAEILDPGASDPGAGQPIYISRDGFMKNATNHFLDHTQLIDENEMNEVTPNLFLGSVKAACDKDVLIKNGITHILSIGYKLPRPHEKHFTYLVFDDVLDYALQDLLPFYEESHRFMDECLASGGKILVHCQMGVSRSGSLVLSFLMRMNRWDFDEAYKSVQTRRAMLDPNIGFQVQMIEFHKQNYSYDMKQYKTFNLKDAIMERMKWGLCNIEQINKLCANDIFERNHEMRFLTLLFASSQEMLAECKEITSLQHKAATRLRYFQSEFVQSPESLQGFDRMFKPSLDACEIKQQPTHL